MLLIPAIILIQAIVEPTPTITTEGLFYLLVGLTSSVIGALVTSTVYLFIRKEKDKDKYIEATSQFREQLSKINDSLEEQIEASKQQAEASKQVAAAASKTSDALDRLKEAMITK